MPSLCNSSNSVISGNSIEKSRSGIWLEYSSNNRFYRNDLIDSEVHVFKSVKSWDEGSVGNYWSNYREVDSNNDGIGDTPYVIDAKNRDRYPLISPSICFIIVLNSYGVASGSGRYEYGTTVAQATEYFVSATSPYGSVTGLGWYARGSTATVSVTQVDTDFFTNIVFEGWKMDGGTASTSPTYSFVVDKSTTLVASWRIEVKTIAICLVAGLILLIITPLAILAVKRKRKLPPPSQ